VLDYQEAVAVLFQDGHKLEGCEGAADIQLGEIAVKPAEDAGVVCS